MSALMVYHGSNCRVKQPLVKVGRENLDFGQGFYVTDLRQQAIQWATRLTNEGQPQWLNIYELDINRIREIYRCLRYESYNKEWLNFIVASRRGKRLWEAFDFIEGGIANDRVVVAVELYYRGEINVRRVLGMLSHHKPNNQICLLSQQLVDECLHYVSSEPLNEEARLEIVTGGGDYVK